MINIGTIGSGPIVDTFLDALNQVDGAQCLAVYSRTDEKAQSFADKHHIGTIYSDLNLFLADQHINTVYVASPNSLHFSQARAALLAGKHVICEKPFTSTVAELEELIDIAEQKQLFLFEAITTLHMPNFAMIKKNLASIGDIKFVQCNYSQYSKKYNALLAGEIPNVFNTDFSGGALMDINIYNIHFVIGLFGQPENTQYFANCHSNGIDTSGVMVMTYDGFTTTCVGCKDSRSINFAMVQGTAGYINVVNGANGCEEVVFVNSEGTKTVNVQSSMNKLRYEIEHFAKIINTNDFSASHQLLQHSLAVLRVVHRSRQQAGVFFAAD